MRRYYLDNIRWITIVLVVVYHVIFMYNGIATDGVIGPFFEQQYQDGLQYILYPWFMILLFIVAGVCSRICYVPDHGAVGYRSAVVHTGAVAVLFAACSYQEI